MPLSRRTLLRYARALSATSALACGDDAPGIGDSGTGSSTSSGAASSSTGAPATTTAVDASSSSGGVDDGLPRYEWEGDPGPESLFSHGIASGDPLTDAVILWTRVTTEEAEAAEAFFEVALDPEFEIRVAADYLETDPDRDHTIKLDVQNLSAGTTYYYRFYTQGRVSAVGRTRTAPTAQRACGRVWIGAEPRKAKASGRKAGPKRNAEGRRPKPRHAETSAVQSGAHPRAEP